MHVSDDLPVLAMSEQIAEQLVMDLDVEYGTSLLSEPRPAQPETELPAWGAEEIGAEQERPDPPGQVELTEEQGHAVERRRGTLLLAAGAGSGKTAVLVERFVRAVLVDGIAPARILAITFTDRAAAELSHRLRRRLLELGEREQARDVEGAIVGTFHTFCARLLRLHPLAAGVSPDFRVLEEAQAARLRAEAFQRTLEAVVAREGEAAVDLLASYGGARLREMLLGAHAELRSRGEEEPRLPAFDAHAPAALGVLGALLAEFGTCYGELKRDRAALDFDDLELRARILLARDAAVRAGWRERFELVMVDELQDVNRRQLALLELLERENLFTVGDEWQSIYGFRHADVELFRGRRRELAGSGEALELTHNFRARPALVDAVNAIFAPRFGEDYRPLVAAREGAGAAEPAVELLLSDRDWGRHEGMSDEPEVQGWRRAEAQMLAQRIEELIADEGVRAREVAVLVRATTGLEAYARALEQRGIATLATVGGFWADKQVRDLLACLRAIANPRDELALHGALASPLAELSRDALALIARAGRAEGGAWAAAQALARDHADAGAALAPADSQRLQSFCELLERARAESAWRGIAGTLLGVLEATGYERRLLAMPSPERWIANVRKLVRLAAAYERQEGADVRGFVDYAAHAEQALARNEPHAPVADEELEAVRLMTIHGAKGLEFPVVCVPELGARPNLRTPDLLVDGDRVGLRLLTLGSIEATPALDFEQLSAERRCAQESEEDRILYVAMTRARERLLLSGVISFRRWPAAREGGPPIEWLAPSLVPDIERHVAGVAGAAVAGAAEEDTACEPTWVAEGAGGAIRCWLNTPPTLGRVLREGALRPHAARLDRPAPAGSVVAREGEAHTAQPETDPPAAPAPGQEAGRGVPEALSYTALTKLERCGYRYYLEDVLGLPEVDDRAARGRGGEGGALARGRMLHRLLESFDFTGHAKVPQERVAELARELGEPLRAWQCERLAAVLEGLRGTELAERLATGGLRREQPFAFVVEETQPLITGAMDAIVREPDGAWLVVDYKSDGVSDGEDLERLVRDQYELQRLIYALAALRDGARRVQVVHWFLERPREPVSADFEASQRGALEAGLRARLNDLAARGHPASEHPHQGLCAGCPGRGTLCSWSFEETLASPVQ
jgi:ATP-dependent exoDNAse (exonuclease V) beta subunit